MECVRKTASLSLCEFLDEAQLEVSDDQEDEGHDSQSQVILPQTPGWIIDALILQELLAWGTTATRQKTRETWVSGAQVLQDHLQLDGKSFLHRNMVYFSFISIALYTKQFHGNRLNQRCKLGKSAVKQR